MSRSRKYGSRHLLPLTSMVFKSGSTSNLQTTTQSTGYRSASTTANLLDEINEQDDHGNTITALPPTTKSPSSVKSESHGSDATINSPTETVAAEGSKIPKSKSTGDFEPRKSTWRRMLTFVKKPFKKQPVTDSPTDFKQLPVIGSPTDFKHIATGGPGTYREPTVTYSKREGFKGKGKCKTDSATVTGFRKEGCKGKGKAESTTVTDFKQEEFKGKSKEKTMEPRDDVNSKGHEKENDPNKIALKKWLEENRASPSKQQRGVGGANLVPSIATSQSGWETEE